MYVLLAVRVAEERESLLSGWGSFTGQVKMHATFLNSTARLCCRF